MDGLSSADRLLIASCSVDIERRDERVRAEADQGVDWARLLGLARLNRIVPLVHQALRSAGREHLIHEEAPHFHEFLQHQALRSLFLYREMVDIARSFQNAGLDVVPYKGPFLSLALYGELGVRQFYDLDLIVRREDAYRAREVLIERGYKSGNDERSLDQLLQEDCELHFRPPDGDPLVELHWDVLPPRHGFGLDISDFWQRLVPGKMEDVDVLTFTPEDLLLVLSIHAGDKHRWNRLQMIADVARLLSVHRDLDWDVLNERAGALGREGVVLQGVLLAWALLDAPLEESVVRRAVNRDEVRTGAALALGRQLRLDAGLPSFDKWRAYHELIDRCARERGQSVRGGSGFLGYLRAAATPEWTDRQALALPPALNLFYYVYRPWRLWRKHRTGLFRRI